MKLALAIIVKDELDLVKGIINKYEKYFDEIALAVDLNIEEFNKIQNEKVTVYPYTWVKDFSHKRNFLAEKVKSEYYFRLDTDDDIDHPELIKDIFDKTVSFNFDVVYFPYIYAKDTEGNCEAKHWRETIIKKRKDIYWKKKIHENVFMEDVNTCKLIKNDQLKIIHNITHEHAIESFNRNYEYLVDEFIRDGENTDPRTIAYIGRALMGKGKFQEAILFLEKLISKSGWDDDKYFAFIQISQCYQILGKLDMAIAAANEALAMNTTYPDAYLQLGTIYLEKQDYNKAVDWLMFGIVRPEPNTTMVVDPTFYTYKAKMNVALALLGKGDVELAWKYFNEAKVISPSNKDILDKQKMFEDAYLYDKFFKNTLWNINFTKERDPNNIQLIIDSLPKSVFIDERFYQLKNKYSQPKTWNDKSIVIYCGRAWEDWGPQSTLTGIGGSEEAVIYISKEFVKLGYEVTVYNSCGDFEGEYEGVKYVPYYAFNPNDKFNVIIGWRQNCLKDINAKKRIVWLHDVPMNGMFTQDNCDDFDWLLVLSEFHKSLIPDVVNRNKIFVSSNGINLSDFDSQQLRNNKRIIYTSSYDRGIQHLLMMWNDVITEVPEAELHLYYGWNTYDEMVKKGARSPDFKIAMTKLMNQKNVFDHGRIGHKQLAKEFLRSGIWAYPSHFEEISCISAMKAQAAGCVPVCTNYAALKETVKTGVIIEGKCGNGITNEEFKKRLIETLKDDSKQEEIRKSLLESKSQFGWDRVAKSWSDNLFNSVPSL